MDLQSAIATALALVCAVWVIREFARPFRGGTSGCTGCGNARADSQVSSERLLEIQSVESLVMGTKK